MTCEDPPRTTVVPYGYARAMTLNKPGSFFRISIFDLLMWGTIVMVVVLLQAYPAKAQSSIASELILSDDTLQADIGPYAYITPDPDTQISFRSLIERFNLGQRGIPSNKSVIPLSASNVPHWIVFLIRNESVNENWVLSFGEHLDGRSGVLGGMLAYDHISGRRYMDTMTHSRLVGLNKKTLSTTAMHVRIPQGEQAFIILYAVPRAGFPATLVPRIMPDTSYLERQTGPFEKRTLVTLFFVIIIGLFLGGILSGNVSGTALFALYFAVQFGLFYNQNSVLYTELPFFNEITLLLYAAVIIVGLFLARSFLDVSPLDRMAHRLVLGAAVGMAFVSFGSLIFLPVESGLRTLLIVMSGQAGVAWIILLSFLQVYHGQYGARQFALAWCVFFFGTLLTTVALSGLFVPTPFMVAGYWYGVIMQGLLFVSAYITKAYMQKQDVLDVAIAEEENIEELKALRQTREAGEIARLRRLIEHEREVMNELRAREVEQSEKMRKAKDAADLANAAKSAFLAVISHEIRTPMTGVMGMVRLLLDSNLTKTQHEYAQTIQDSGDAMLALLNDILDFEKIESDKLELEPVDFDLQRIINGVVTLMSGHAAAKGIYLRAEVDPGLPRYVVGDPVRLRQVLLNLTGNSIKFTGQGGVTLRVEIVGQPVDNMHALKFSVEDTGIGISPEAQKNLFNPFSQADKSITRKFGGTGLGLTISQRLINAMGGRIEIDSVEGKGSTFFFKLEMREGRADRAERDAASPVEEMPGKKMQVLVVEDNEINQRLVKEFIHRLGHHTILASSGEEALEIIAGNRFDLILMDINLPGMTGMGTTKAIRALPDRVKAAMPVIALSGNIREEDIRNCYAANMNGHLAKPVDPRRLKDVITKVIENRLDNPVKLPDDGVGDNRPTMVNRIDLPLPGTAEALADKNEALQLEPPSQVTDRSSQITDEHVNGEAAPGRSVFDEQFLISLKTTMSKDQLSSLVMDLFAKADELVDILNTDEILSDINAVMSRAHELKGMAGNFGLTELNQIAAKAEQAARDNQTDSLPALLSSLPDANRRAKAELESWVAS